MQNSVGHDRAMISVTVGTFKNISLRLATLFRALIRLTVIVPVEIGLCLSLCFRFIHFFFRSKFSATDVGSTEARDKADNFLILQLFSVYVNSVVRIL